MFGFRRRILGPTTVSAAKRSLRGNNMPMPTIGNSPCGVLRTEARITTLLTETISKFTRRSLSTTVHLPDSVVVSREGSLPSFVVVTPVGGIVAPTTTATIRSSTDGNAAVAVASKWLALAWERCLSSTSGILNDGLLLISTLKRRRKMMNKHKLRKRRKKNRMKNKK